jgi:Nucleotidyltransferase domain.
MKRGAPSIIANRPIGAEFFVFGSAAHGEDPADLDVLVIYDPDKLPSNQVRERSQAWLGELESATRLKVHSVMLTKAEERQVRFRSCERAISFDRFWQRFTLRSARKQRFVDAHSNERKEQPK